MNANLLRAILPIALFDARSSASLNPTLTTFAAAVAAEIDISDATFLAPIVETGSTLGHFKRYDQKEAIVVYETARAMGQMPNEIGFTADDPTFDCKPHALACTIDDDERENDAVNLDEIRIRDVVTAYRRAFLQRVVGKLRAAKAAHATRGAWLDPAVNPIMELNGSIAEVAQDTGYMPNSLWLDMGMWTCLTNHPAVLDRVSGIEVGASLAAIAKMLTNNPAIQIKIGTAIYDPGKRGANAVAPKFIGGGTCFVFYKDTNPTMHDPSFAKTFSKNGDITGDVRSWRKEPVADCHGVFASEDIQVTSSVSGIRIDLKGAPEKLS